MKLVLDNNLIQTINLFENLTGAMVIDCVDTEDEIFFVVHEGQYGLAVGKGGVKIKHAERIFKKKIKVYEYSADMMQFIKNLVPESDSIVETDKIIQIKVGQNSRARVIGKSGKNIKVLNELVKRLFDIEAIKIK